MRRAWAAVGRGRWTIAQLLRQWRAIVEAEGQWQPRTHGGYQAVAADVTAVLRPRLTGCATTHYHAAAGKALPAIPWACGAHRRGGRPTARAAAGGGAR